MPPRRRKSQPDGMEEDTNRAPPRKSPRSNTTSKALRTAEQDASAASSRKVSDPGIRKGEHVFEGVMHVVGGGGTEPGSRVRYQWLLGGKASRRRFALRVIKYIFWTYLVWLPILSMYHAERYAWWLYLLGGTVLWVGAFFREPPETLQEVSVSKEEEDAVRLHWLLGNADSRRRFGIRVFKYMGVMYMTLMALLTLWSAQRWGFLFQGRSFYLPHHSPGQMRKTAMAFRNMFYTVASSHGYRLIVPPAKQSAMPIRRASAQPRRAAIERMILVPNDKIFDLSPLAYDATANPDLPDPPESSELGLDIATRVLRKIDRVFASVKPSSLFEQGEGQPFVKVKGGSRDAVIYGTGADVDGLRSRALFEKTGPITLIIFPGVVSEFIETAVFSEFEIWDNSSLSAEWRHRLEACAKTVPEEEHLETENCDQSDTVDRRFSLDHLKSIAQPLADLVSLASIDAPLDGCGETALAPSSAGAAAAAAAAGGDAVLATEDAGREVGRGGGERSGTDASGGGRCARFGKRLVNIVRMDARFGSLETVGSLERTSTMYIRRLSKVFNIMGPALTNCYIVGYSRGAAVALDTLVRATGSNKASGSKAGGAVGWAGRIKGIVSLAGVLFGTEAADTILDKTHVHGRLMDTIISAIDLIDYSHEGDMGTVAHATEIASNTKILVEMGLELAAILAGKEVPKAMAKEFSRIGAPTPDFAVIGNMLNKFLLNTFNLHKPVSSYYDNVRKFKIVIEKVFTGLVELTTEERLKWWRSNALPSAPISYYALTATMPDPPPLKQKDEDKCSRAKLDFAADSADSMALRALFYDMLDVTAHLGGGGKQLNDGNVAVDRAMFWPALSRLLNPRQVAFRNVFLGILNGHHWNIAMPSVFDPVSDPFPRMVLVEALAAFLAQEQITNGT